jgi:hypothetical protein
MCRARGQPFGPKGSRTDRSDAPNPAHARQAFAA